MEVKKILEFFDSNVPLSLSYDAQKNVGFYDNSGLLIDCAEQTDSVVCALDLTSELVDYAISVGSKLIITHHPVIYRGVKKVDGVYVKAIKNGISIYSAHLNFDSASGGIEDTLAKFAGAISQPQIIKYVNETNGFGRKFFVNEQTAESVVNSLIAQLPSQNYMFYGNKEQVVKRVATFCGAGLGEDGVNSASDCDMLISADMQHHVILSALEQGKCVLQLTHYASEAFAMKAFVTELFEKGLKIKNYFYLDKRFL